MTRVAEFSFGTKAETLVSLASLVTTATVPETYFVSAGRWADERATVLAEAHAHFGDQTLAVRSSALAEDAANSSMAGAFLSLLNVPGSDPTSLATAIDDVVASMTGNPADQVIIQRMVGATSVSGVLMTFDVAHGAPYYCIDYDDETGRTDVVTSGNGVHKSIFIHRDTTASEFRSARVAAFVALARELEQITDCAALDIEFCMTEAGELVLLQVRRIVLARNWHPVIERRVRRELSYLRRHLDFAFGPRTGLLGKRTVYAVMPDWNPAEIIGTMPRPLAASLYRNLITDHVWHEAREQMGYRALPQTPLMATLHHHPFIDVRNSFNSFLPSGLSDEIGAKLVEAWIDRLQAHPEFHDKVEFEIVTTCMTFDFEASFAARYPGLLSDAEFAQYRDALTALTKDCLDPAIASLDGAIAKADKLGAMPIPLSSPADTDEQGHLEQAVYLINACRAHGTLPFSIAARHAFIAEALMRSAVTCGALTEARLEHFRRSVHTYSSTMMADFAAVSAGKLEETSFLARYGHLRPGTYEVTSLRYDEREDLFHGSPGTSAMHHHRFEATPDELSKLTDLLATSGLDVLSAETFLGYAARAIAAREDVKFAFTRTLSDALSHLSQWGASNGLSGEDVSHLEWPEIAALRDTPILEDVDRHFLPMATARRQALVAAQTTKLPHIIFEPSDIHMATLNRSVPNFVGTGRALGKVLHVAANSTAGLEIAGVIVCIDNADPGFDWIFAKGPAALITRFGGVNSHMAVRCAELGIPAAIGCGDQVFDRIAGATQAELNCAEKIIRPVHGS